MGWFYFIIIVVIAATVGSGRPKLTSLVSGSVPPVISDSSTQVRDTTRPFARDVAEHNRGQNHDSAYPGDVQVRATDQIHQIESHAGGPRQA